MKRHMHVFVSLALAAFLFGCAAVTQPPQACSPPAQQARLVQKADNFLVILDTSETMAGQYKTASALQLATCTVARMNQCIPDIRLNGGLRVYGRGYWLFSIGQTDLLYGMTPYEKSGLSEALGNVTLACGDSPMAKALTRATEDLKPLSGTSAVILVSDGKATDQGVTEAAQAMKKAFGDRVCIYTIQIGDDYNGAKLLEQIAKIGGCGFSVNADKLAGCSEMSAFVEQVFFTNTCPDADGDSVCDGKDACPGTPAGAKVNAQGCWVIEDVLFDLNKAVLKPAAAPVLDQCVAVLKKCPSVKISIEGHTDNTGSAGYNLDLSRRRAEAVQRYFAEHGICAANLSAQGFGLSKPAASNSTPQGRAKNRRVELHVK